MFLTALWDKEEVELCIVSPEFPAYFLNQGKELPFIKPVATK